MRRKVVKNLKGASGITLIALVITIIVLLILAGVSIAMLTGDNGILKQANKAKVETRGASVQEVRDLWFIEKKLNAAKSLDEVLQGLRDQDLLTDEEVAEVKETGQVTIGSRTIVFGKDIELVARVIYDNYEDKYAIAVGFKDYQVNSDWKSKLGTDEQLGGEITDPSGNKAVITTANIDIGDYGYNLFESYAYIYEITKNGEYTFSFLGKDGQTGNITVTIDENNPCIVFDENFNSITLIAGINNFIAPEKARTENAIYREEYTGPKNFDMTDRISEDDGYNFKNGVKELELSIGKHFDANVILTYDGKEYTTKADFWIPN